MGIRVSPGFTIIEVMLFLSVTGLMIAGIMASAGDSLNSQRYRDGVEAIRNSISSEYAKVYSLTNVRGTDDPCGVGAPVSNRTWGTSDCFYAGRLVEITGTGDQKINVYPVTAREVDEDQTELLDRFEFKAVTAGELVETREMEWGLSAVRPGTNNPMKVLLLIVRSPVDGSVLTYNISGDPTPVLLNDSMRDPVALTAQTEFCIADLKGSLDPGAGSRQAIIIHARATSVSDIESVMGNGQWGVACQ